MNDPKRVYHRISGPKKCEMPQRFAVVAIAATTEETKDKPNRRQHHLRCGYIKFFTRREGLLQTTGSSTFHNSGELWDILSTRRSSSSPVTVIGHSMAVTLTLTGFWREIDCGRIQLVSDSWRLKDIVRNGADDWRKGMLCIEDPPIIIHAWYSAASSRITILDARNYWPMSAPEMHASLRTGVAAAKDEATSLSQAESGCVGECHTLARCLESLLGTIVGLKLGGLRPTIAGCAYSGYLRSYIEADIYSHDDADALALERRAIYGGRCEVFRHGELRERMYHVDCNSLYPYVMKEGRFPTMIVGHKDHPAVTDMPGMLEEYAVVAECRIHSNHDTYPYSGEDGVIYPTGDYWTVLNSPEIAHAIEHCNLVEVGRCVAYEQVHLFRRWVSRLYEERLRHRLEGNWAGELAVKMMLNGLSGKFAQLKHRWHDDHDEPARMPWGLWCKRELGERLPAYYRSVYWRVQRHGVPEEGRESCPSIYGHITSMARVVMTDLIDLCGRENVYYMDTDSLHVNQHGYERLLGANMIDPDAIGSLKLLAEADYARYYGVKDYQFGSKITIGAASVSVHTAGDRSPEQWTYPRLATQLAARPGSYMEGLLSRRQLSPCNVRGSVQADGTVVPWRIVESYDQYLARMDDREAGRASSHPTAIESVGGHGGDGAT